MLSSSGKSARSNRSSNPLVFEIDKAQARLYRVGVLSSGVEVKKPLTILELRSHQRGGLLQYQMGSHTSLKSSVGASRGTLPIPKIVETASQIAEHLVGIAAEMRAR